MGEDGVSPHTQRESAPMEMIKENIQHLGSIPLEDEFQSVCKRQRKKQLHRIYQFDILFTSCSVTFDRMNSYIYA